MNTPSLVFRSFVLASTAALALTACGGGEADPAASEAAGADSRMTALADSTGPSDAQRSSAAAATAQSTTNACAAARPFYWEIGNAGAKLASGSVASSTTPLRVTATLPMSIASASKWVYSSYVAQKLDGKLSDADRKFLNFRSGYTSFSGCDPTQTVDSCLASGSNGAFSSTTDGEFFYNGGHMEKHASLLGLGALNNAGLAAEMKRLLGSELPFVYTQPQLAGGIATSADGYAKLLRKIVGGQLKMNALLGTSKVCTNPAECGLDEAIYTPSPVGEYWHYSVGHWVEDDPVVGDGAFSSPGAFGFYPWIDASKRYYGVLSRFAPDGAWDSIYCGRLIRKAWLSGAAL